MNIITLTGNNVRDIDLTFSPQGTAFAKGTIAVQRNFKDKNNEYKTDFINFKVIGKLAETVANFVSKGDKFGISGSLQIDEYEKDGVKKYYTEVVVSSFDFPNKKKEENQQQPLNQPMYGGNPNQPQGQFHTGGQAPQQSYQWSQQQQQQPNYTRVDEDPFANSKGPTNQEIEDSLPF